jgi:hypothetical protein
MTCLCQIALIGLLLLGSHTGAVLADSAPRGLDPPSLPRPSATAYVSAQDGHFFLDGRRVRFWGFNLQAGAFPGYDAISQLVDRLARLGVNAVRLWPIQGTFYDGNSLPERRFTQMSMGDGSLLDRYDFFISELKRKGIFVQNPALHYVDIDAIRYWPDPETRRILGPKASADDIRKLHGIAPYLSAGWEAMLATHIRNYLGHVNPYTQHAYADEPVFSGWELANESQFVQCALRRSCVSELPPFLRGELTRHWHAYSKQKGGKADLDLPVYDSDWDRTNSVMHAAYRQFVFDRFVTVSQRLEGIARGMAPVGKGIAVQPISYSTQAGDPLLVARVAYSAGDYSAVGAYQTPMDKNTGSPFFPFRLNLANPVYYNFNYGAVQGKPTVVYENSFFRPYPYRAEWPWALLYLAAMQDWDALFLYTYGQPWAIYDDEPGKPPRYGDKPLPIPSDPQDSAPHGVYVGLHHGGDEVSVAAWSAAGLVFLSGELASGVETANFPFNQAQIFGPAPGYCALPGCGAGGRQLMSEMNAASLTKPIRLLWSADVKRKTGKPTAIAHRSTASSRGLVLDRTLPRLVIDTPGSKAVAGILDGIVRFDGGIVLRFPRRQFGFVSVIAVDGNKLSTSRDIRVFASGKSTNTGFEFDPGNVDFKNPTGVVSGVRNAGQAPVVFERPTFMLELPKAFTQFDRFDFNLRPYQTVGKGTSLSIRSDEPFFTGVISE